MTTLGKFSAACVVALIVGLVGFNPLKGALRSAEKKKETHRRADRDLTLDLELLDRVKLGDDASRLVYLRKHSPSDEDLLGVELLIRQLGSGNFKERQSAEERLIRLNLVALPHLRKARADRDPEIATRAAKCVRAIEVNTRLSVPLSVVRVLLDHVPEGTVPALLRYLPFTRDEEVEQEIAFGLYELSKETGKLDPALIAALADALPERRALAACIVGRLGNKEQRAKVRRLLEDAAPLVRLRAAQGLLATEDVAGILTLIRLLEEPAAEISWQAEELLSWFAGVQGPGQAGKLSEPRAKRRQTWERWWHVQGPKFRRVPTPRQGPPRLILVCENDEDGTRTTAGRVVLYGTDAAPRWLLEGQEAILGVQFLGGSRLLIAEEARVFEREVNGAIVWKSDLLAMRSRSTVFQRQANGIILIYHHSGVTEISPDGAKESYHRFDAYNKPLRVESDSVHRLGNGQVVCQPSSLDAIWRLDLGRGRLCQTIKLESRAARRDALRVLRGKRLLLQEEERCAELDWRGKPIWILKGAKVETADELPGGNVLLGEHQPVSRVREVTRQGKTVWECYPRGKITCVHSCLGQVALGFDDLRDPLLDLDDLSALSGALRGGSLAECRKAVELLYLAGEKATVAIPNLVEALGASDERIRSGAKRVLTRIGRASFPTLRAAMKDRRELVRAEAAYCLTSVKAPPSEVIPILTQALKDNSWQVRRAAAFRLGDYRSDATEAVPNLLKALRDDVEGVRLAAAGSLGQVGRGAEGAIPTLLTLMRKGSKEECKEAVRAMGEMGSVAKAAVPALISALKDSTYREAHHSIIGALGEIGKEAAPAVPVIVARIQNEDETGLLVTAWALGRIGPPARAAVPALLKMLNDQSKKALWTDLIQTLGRIAGRDDGCLPVLERLRNDPDDDVSWAAKIATHRIKDR